jgi:UDP-2,3-diacylglucosamine pyrophosphatase LpxH
MQHPPENAQPQDSGAQPEDLYIFSDLHLGEGRSANTRRHSRMEAFFYDQEYSNLVDQILADRRARTSRARIILNGDIFDFLAVVVLPDARELRQWGFRLERMEHRLGLAPTAQKSAWKMQRILRGHPLFFRALLRAVAEGVSITVIRGNHDVELFWKPVREAFYAGLEELAAGAPRLSVTRAELEQAVVFDDWFYYEPGRIYVEHGHQYEASNSFRYNLQPALPARFTGAEADTLDYPTGSHFVRYVFNRIKHVDPFTTYFVSWERYLWLLGRASFFDIVRILTLHVPFLVRALRFARFFELHGMEEVATRHAQEVDDTAARKGLRVEQVRELDALLVAPVGKTKYSLAQEVMRPLARTAITVFALGLLSLSAWFLVFSLIHSTGWIASSLLIKASLLALLAAATAFGLSYGFLKVHRRLSAKPDPFSRRYRAVAERIAEIVDVPFVSMGHTHGADLRAFQKRRGFYANTGTWIATPSAWDILKPKARQFTFVRVTGFDLELLRWDDSAGRWEPVLLLDDYEPSPLERLFAEDDSGPAG